MEFAPVRLSEFLVSNCTVSGKNIEQMMIFLSPHQDSDRNASYLIKSDWEAGRQTENMSLIDDWRTFISCVGQPKELG